MSAVLGAMISSAYSTAVSAIVKILHKKNSHSYKNEHIVTAVEEIVAPNLDVLNCLASLKREDVGNVVSDFFSISICGKISCHHKMLSAVLELKAFDVTDDQHLPINGSVKKYLAADGSFLYKNSLGKLPQAETLIKDWLNVAKIQTNWLLLPLSGARKIKFSGSILSAEDNSILACADCVIPYNNLFDGYIDLQNKLQRTKTLAVAVAFSVSAADRKMYSSEISVIKNWARINIGSEQASEESFRQLDDALGHTLDFFKSGHSIDYAKVCQEIMQISNSAQRYDILELCIQVAKAKGVIVADELTLLQRISKLLDVDFSRCRLMMEKSISRELMQMENTEVLLGVTADMPEDEARFRLNQEYRKWNARVTNTDPQIRSQADSMLKFIAEARMNIVK